MSVVIAMRDKEGVVHLASDSRASTSFVKTDYDVCKVTPTLDKDLIIGFVGELCLSELQYYNYFPEAIAEERGSEMGKLLKELDQVYKDTIDEKDFVTEIKYTIAETIAKIKCSSKDKIPQFDGRLILAFRDQMYLMDGDYSIIPIKEKWVVIGSGQYHATPVLKVLEGLKYEDPQSILATAIKIAGDSVLSVGGKIYYTNTKDCEVIEIELEEAPKEEIEG